MREDSLGGDNRDLDDEDDDNDDDKDDDNDDDKDDDSDPVEDDDDVMEVVIKEGGIELEGEVESGDDCVVETR